MGQRIGDEIAEDLQASKKAPAEPEAPAETQDEWPKPGKWDHYSKDDPRTEVINYAAKGKGAGGKPTASVSMQDW